jgi:tight adherence protein B
MRALLDRAFLQIPPVYFVGALFGVFALFFLIIWAFLKINIFINVLFSFSTTILAAWMFLRDRKNYYIDEFVKQMPQVAILLSNSLKSGMSVAQSVNVVADRLEWPAGVEFTQVTQEISLGYSVEEALVRLNKRVSIPEMNTIVITVQVLRQSGGNLSEALSLMANAIMGRERVRAEVKALTSEARYTGMALLVLPVLILFMINGVQPGSVTRFLNNPVGMFIMFLFIGVQFAAYLLISRYSQIKV